MIIPEDGTGIVGANSYTSVDAANDWHDLRQNTAWSALSIEAKVAALIRATDHIDATYRALGEPLVADQGLQFPIAGSTALPKALVEATISAALTLATTVPATGRGIKSEKLSGDGVGSIETVYDDVPAIDPLAILDTMLSGITVRRDRPVSSRVSFATVTR